MRTCGPGGGGVVVIRVALIGRRRAQTPEAGAQSGKAPSPSGLRTCAVLPRPLSSAGTGSDFDVAAAAEKGWAYCWYSYRCCC
jgi:hypothetical protein